MLHTYWYNVAYSFNLWKWILVLRMHLRARECVEISLLPSLHHSREEQLRNLNKRCLRVLYFVCLCVGAHDRFKLPASPCQSMRWICCGYGAVVWKCSQSVQPLSRNCSFSCKIGPADFFVHHMIATKYNCRLAASDVLHASTCRSTNRVQYYGYHKDISLPTRTHLVRLITHERDSSNCNPTGLMLSLVLTLKYSWQTSLIHEPFSSCQTIIVY